MGRPVFFPLLPSFSFLLQIHQTFKLIFLNYKVILDYCRHLYFTGMYQAENELSNFNVLFHSSFLYKYVHFFPSKSDGTLDSV